MKLTYKILWIFLPQLFTINCSSNRQISLSEAVESDNRDKVILVESNKEKGYYWPFLLHIPSYLNGEDDVEIFVLPNNTGINSDHINVQIQESRNDFENKVETFASELKLQNVFIQPIFPRPKKWFGGKEYYYQQLERKVLLLEKDKQLKNSFEPVIRLDLQLLAMVDDLIETLNRNPSLSIGSKFVMWGFSASGDFVDRFSLIHPERVSKVWFGGCRNMLPISEWNEVKLPYPIGTYDYELLFGKQFDFEAFSKIKRFSIRGDNDGIGWVSSDKGTQTTEEYWLEKYLPNFKELTLDISSPDTQISDIEQEFIRLKLNKDTLSVRNYFLNTQTIFDSLNLINSKFKLYQNTEHEINKPIRDDLIQFLTSK